MESRDGVGVGRSAATLIIAAVLVCAAASQAKSLLAPLAAALFIIGVVWPAQRWLQSLMPKLAALAITILFTTTVCLAFASLAVWAFGRVGQFLVADARGRVVGRVEGLMYGGSTEMPDALSVRLGFFGRRRLVPAGAIAAIDERTRLIGLRIESTALRGFV